jgi:hypothetical protein
MQESQAWEAAALECDALRWTSSPCELATSSQGTSECMHVTRLMMEAGLEHRRREDPSHRLRHKWQGAPVRGSSRSSECWMPPCLGALDRVGLQLPARTCVCIICVGMCVCVCVIHAGHAGSRLGDYRLEWRASMSPHHILDEAGVGTRGCTAGMAGKPQEPCTWSLSSQNHVERSFFCSCFACEPFLLQYSHTRPTLNRAET